MNASAVARVLGAVALVLLLASVAGQLVRFILEIDQLKRWIALFYLDGERNIPTYFSALLVLVAALLLAIIAVLGQRQNVPHATKWAVLSVGFLVMGFDEAFEFHERLISPIRGLLGDGNLSIFHFAWTLPAIALVFFLGLYFARFLLQLPANTRSRFCFAAALYLGGAIGIELIGGSYAKANGQQSLAFSMIATLEECLEIAGLIFFIWALIKFFADRYPEVQFRFEA